MTPTPKRVRTAEAVKVIENVLPTIPSESRVNVLHSVLSDRLTADQLERLGNLLGRAADEKRRA